MRVVNGVETYYSHGKYTYPSDTAYCSTNTSNVTPQALPAPSCGTGQKSVYVNNQFMCVNDSTGEPVDTTPNQTTTSSTTTTTNPNGSTTKTTTYKDNATGETYTEEQTTNTDGSTTTTTTGKQPNDISNFCKENPLSSICKGSSVVAGTGCTTAPTCEGDAIQCHLLRQSWEAKCSAAKTNEALGEGSEQAAALAAVGNWGMTGENADNSQITTTVNVSGQISTQKFLSGACIADKVIALPMGKTLTIPFSSLCPYLEIFGNILIALAMLAAARIVGVF